MLGVSIQKSLPVRTITPQDRKQTLEEINEEVLDLHDQNIKLTAQVADLERGRDELIGERLELSHSRQSSPLMHNARRASRRDALQQHVQALDRRRQELKAEIATLTEEVERDRRRFRSSTGQGERG